MMKLEDVLKRVDTCSELCISRPDYNKGGNGEKIVFEGYYDEMKYDDVRPFFDYKVLGIMAGSEDDGKPGVLYIDIARPEDKEFMI